MPSTFWEEDSVKIYKEEKNVVYLQGYEAMYLVLRQPEVPESLLDELCNYTQSRTLAQTRDSYDFDCKIMRPSNVTWIMNQDWIVDFSQYNNMNSFELRRLITIIKQSFCEEISRFNAESKAFRDENYAATGILINRKRHQVSSMELFIEYLDGTVEFGFPDEEDEQEPPHDGNIFQKMLTQFGFIV